MYIYIIQYKKKLIKRHKSFVVNMLKAILHIFNEI